MPDLLNNTVAIAFPEVALKSVLEGISILLIGAYILTLMLIKFYNILILILIVFKILSAQLRKIINLFIINPKYLLYNNV